MCVLGFVVASLVRLFIQESLEKEEQVKRQIIDKLDLWENDKLGIR